MKTSIALLFPVLVGLAFASSAHGAEGMSTKTDRSAAQAAASHEDQAAKAAKQLHEATQQREKQARTDRDKAIQHAFVPRGPSHR